MKKFIVSTPHPDSLAGADYRQDIFGPFNSIPEAEEFRDWFHKKFLRGAGPKEDLIQIGELNDPFDKVQFKTTKKKMSVEDKLSNISKGLGAVSPTNFFGSYVIYHWLSGKAEVGSICMVISYATRSLGFDLYKAVAPAGKSTKDMGPTLIIDGEWDCTWIKSIRFKLPKPIQDPFLLLEKEVKWIILKEQGLKKKYNAPISPV